MTNIAIATQKSVTLLVQEHELISGGSDLLCMIADAPFPGRVVRLVPSSSFTTEDVLNELEQHFANRWIENANAMTTLLQGDLRQGYNLPLLETITLACWMELIGNLLDATTGQNPSLMNPPLTEREERLARILRAHTTTTAVVG